MKIVVERSGAAALAAVIKDQRFIGKKVCVILTGGNIDFSTFFESLKSNINIWSDHIDNPNYKYIIIKL